MAAEGKNGSGAPAMEQLVDQVKDAVKAGRIADAMELSRTALSRGSVHPLFLNLRAFWLEDRNRPREALADLQLAAKMAPDDALLHNSLGLCLTKFGRWDEAVAAFESAIADETKLVRDKVDLTAAVYFNLGSARECAGDLEGAKSAFERSRTLDPQNPQPLSSLASLAARRSDWDAARMLAEQALAADPNQFLAQTTLANAAVATGDLANAGTLISSALGNPTLPPVDRAMMLTLLGDLRHAQERYGDAFDAYIQGNTLRRQLFAGQYAVPGRETSATFTQWLTGYLDRAPRSAWTVADKPVSAAGPAVTSHVFLLGFARSGTTLLENVLASHPGIRTLEEKEFLAEAAQEFLSSGKGPDALAAADEATLDRHRRTYWNRVARHCGDVANKVFVDKRPFGAMRLPVIAKLFPTAKILFAVRDPRDVVLSCFRRQFLMSAPMYEFLELRSAARFYALLMQLSAVCREKFGQPWQEARHEALIDDFEGEMRRICAFIGVEWSSEMGDFAQKSKDRAIATASAAQVVRGLNREGVEQWRHYRERLAPVFPTLRPWIEKFGYPPY